MEHLLLTAEQPGFDVFGFRITWYAFVIVIGMILAFLVITLLFKRRNMSGDLMLTYFCICLPIALVTTRLFYCITDGMPISEWLSFESIRRGGLSIIGGILGGLFSVLGVSYFKKINFLRVGDCIVVGLILAQAIGRWGNFFNQEVYGGLVENEALHFFPISVYIDAKAEWHYAFFFYESMSNLIIAALMFWNAWKNPYKPNGVNTAIYFMGYGLVRSIMEPLRDSTYILQGGGVPWSLVFSILLFLFGTALLVTVLVINKKKEGKYIGSANGDPYAITKYLKDTNEEVAYLTKINMMCKVYPENYVEKPKKDKDGTSQEESKKEGE